MVQLTRNGRFRECWNPIRARLGGRVAVTRDGYIWSGIHWAEPPLPGLPILVHRKGRKSPVLDFRYRLPKHFEEEMRKALIENGFKWKEGVEWMADWFEAGPSQVAFSLYSKLLPSEGIFGRSLWMLVRSDGSKVLETKVCVNYSPMLAANGTIWLVDYDMGQDWRWSKIWIYKRGEEKGKPLIDRSVEKEPWADKIILGKVGHPLIE